MDKVVLLSLIIWIILLIAMVVIFAKPFSKKAMNYKDYSLAGQSVNKYLISASLLGSYIGGGTIIAFAGRVSSTGLAFIFAPIGVSIAFILLGKYAKSFRVKAKSPVDRLVIEYGEKVKWPVFFIFSIILLCFITVQLYAGSLLISEVLNTTPFYASIVIIAVVLIYSWLGGSKGDIITDLLQVVVIFGTIVFSFSILFSEGTFFDSLCELHNSNSDLLKPLSQGYGWLIAMIVLPLFSILTDGAIHHRLYCAKSDSEAKKAANMAAVLYIIFGILLVFIVLTVMDMPNIRKGDYVLIDFALTNVNPVIKVGFSIAIFSAILSTMDSQAILLGSIVAHDLFFKKGAELGKKEISEIEWEKRKGKVARLFVPVVILFAFIISFFFYSESSNQSRLFIFLSSIWVIGISCFGVPFLALKFEKLSKIIKKSDLIVYQLIWSVIITLTAIIWQTSLGNDPVGVVLPLGVLLVLINFSILYIVGLIKLKNEKQLNK